MSPNLNSFKEFIKGTTIGDIEEDARNLDCSSCAPRQGQRSGNKSRSPFKSLIPGFASLDIPTYATPWALW